MTNLGLDLNPMTVKMSFAELVEDLRLRLSELEDHANVVEEQTQEAFRILHTLLTWAEHSHQKIAADKKLIGILAKAEICLSVDPGDRLWQDEEQ